MIRAPGARIGTSHGYVSRTQVGESAQVHVRLFGATLAQAFEAKAPATPLALAARPPLSCHHSETARHPFTGAVWPSRFASEWLGRATTC